MDLITPGGKRGSKIHALNEADLTKIESKDNLVNVELSQI